MERKYDLVGIDGNAFSVMGYVTRAMRREGYSREQIAQYQAKATSGSYDELLSLSIEMIDEINDKIEGIEEEGI